MAGGTVAGSVRDTAAMVELGRPEQMRECYERDGLIPLTWDLGRPGLVAELRRDLPRYQVEIDRLRAEGVHRVPYLLTEPIVAAAHDERILAVASALLGTGELVMWGPNLQVGTPNEAGLWHTDLESWLWPTVTVVVGLRGCGEANSTQCVPGSHKLPAQPWAIADNTRAAAVLAGARYLDPRCGEIQRFAGFADGRFYAFDAKCWHAGAQSASAGRELLFLHYDRADRPRIPYMKDYEDHTWFGFPAAYLSVPAGGAVPARAGVYPVTGQEEYRGTVPPGVWFT